VSYANVALSTPRFAHVNDAVRDRPPVWRRDRCARARAEVGELGVASSRPLAVATSRPSTRGPWGPAWLGRQIATRRRSEEASDTRSRRREECGVKFSPFLRVASVCEHGGAESCSRRCYRRLGWASSGELLCHDVVLDRPCAASAVLLRPRDADEASARELACHGGRRTRPLRRVVRNAAANSQTPCPTSRFLAPEARQPVSPRLFVDCRRQWDKGSRGEGGR